MHSFFAGGISQLWYKGDNAHRYAQLSSQTFCEALHGVTKQLQFAIDPTAFKRKCKMHVSGLIYRIPTSFPSSNELTLDTRQ